MVLIFILWSFAFTVKIVYAAITDPNIDNYSMKDAILVILINVISDIIPEISILEVKFIDVFRSQNSVSDSKSRVSGEDRLSVLDFSDSNGIKGSLITNKGNP